jgi:taurine dioxygenase
MTHPVTGRRGLFGISGSAWGIEGMGDEEALDLLRSLKRLALRPRFRQRARASAQSILMWDNFRVIHCATPTVYSDADGERRRLLRISTTGLPPAILAPTTTGHGSTST